MKRLFLILIVLLGLKSYGQKNFEGLIKFSTHIKAEHDFKEQLIDKYGDSLLMYYSKNGDFKRVYKNSSEKGNNVQLYIAEGKMLYFTGKNNERDSLDITINSLRLISERKIANEQIMNLDCECYQYEATSTYDQHVILTYCYSRKTPGIKPDFYAEHNDFFLNDFYKKTKKPYLKFSIQTEDFTLTYIASELITKSFDKNFFKLK